MTEQEWLASTGPEPMLEFLRGALSGRKQQLFASACLRRIWHRFTDDRTRNAAEVVDRQADGRAAVDEISLAQLAANEAAADAEDAASPWEVRFLENRSAYAAAASAAHAAWFAAKAVCLVLEDARRVSTAATYAATAAAEGARGARYAAADDARLARAAAKAAGEAERQAQVHLVRDIVGNPFRPPRMDPAWLTWNDGLVRKLARDAYQHRQLPSGLLEPARVSVLADALEDACCTEATLLQHLRGEGPHVRGCWAVDLLTGRR